MEKSHSVHEAFSPRPDLSLSSYLYSKPKVSFQEGQCPQAAAHTRTVSQASGIVLKLSK
ncbi:hypothetical protein ACRRTK_022199 [Alexandromys fortis]